MIRRCEEGDFGAILIIINDAARAYQGVIPADRWTEPYMAEDELRHEMAQGVEFWGFEEGGELLGIIGVQPVHDVTLIRHAYVRPARQGQGIGGRMLAHLCAMVTRPMLIGTWADATWAIRFYASRGFRPVQPNEIERLLGRYWSIPARQVETSVVLADEKWFARHGHAAERRSGRG